MAKPNGPLVLNPDSTYNANILQCLPFNESSGVTVAGLAGVDFDTAGTEDVDFERITANNGNYFSKILGLNSLVSPAKDETQTTGSLVLRIRTPASFAASANFWTTGSNLNAGNGQARVLSNTSSQLQFSARINGANVPLALVGTFSVNTWYTVVVTWTTTNIKAYTIDDTATKITVDSGVISWPGIVFIATTKETLITASTGGMEYFLRLDTVVDEDEYLADPFQDLMTMPAAGLDRVEVKVGSGDWQRAAGTANWVCPVKLAAGGNTICYSI